MSVTYRPLPVPPDAAGAEQAVELIRAWVIDGQLQVSLFPTVWQENPGEWGSLLADIAHHIANALGEKTGRPVEPFLRAIRLGFDAYIKADDREHSGEFL